MPLTWTFLHWSLLFLRANIMHTSLNLNFIFSFKPQTIHSLIHSCVSLNQGFKTATV